MGKIATTIDKQIDLLLKRGLKIDDRDKATEILMDIGYYRLGFYWFYFQDSRNEHKFICDISLEDIVQLYYLDFDIKHLLSKYIYRIEVHFRTQLVYYVSNHYVDNNIWYIDDSVVDKSILKEFNSIYYNLKNSKNSIISKHHTKYPNTSYAPAWKTFEFLTFGQIFKFYKHLKDEEIKKEIANVYGFRNYKMLENYFLAIINIRNMCSHNSVLYDYNQPVNIWKIPNKYYRVKSRNNNNLNASIRLILFIVSKISKNRAEELEVKLKDIFNNFKGNEEVLKVINNKISFDL